MDLGSIKYIFQIPISWFNAVSRLLKIHGGDCISYDPNAEDGPVIALDTERVKNLIEKQIGGISGNVAANNIVKTDSEGSFAALVSLPTSNVAKDKVLTVLKGGTAVTWEDAAAQNHSSPKDLTISGEGTVDAKAGQNDSWTCGGATGVTFTVQTRTFYDHTTSTPVLYGYYRTFTFDRNGRLYSVSVETRYEIDTPVVANLTQ